MVVTSVFKRMSCTGGFVRTAEAGISLRMNAGRKVDASCEKASRTQGEQQLPRWNRSQSDPEEIFLGKPLVSVKLFITWVSPHYKVIFTRRVMSFMCGAAPTVVICVTRGSSHGIARPSHYFRAHFRNTCPCEKLRRGFAHERGSSEEKQPRINTD